MAVKKVGTLIREARTAKKLSQEDLAGEIRGLSGSDIGRAERGEKDLTQTQLKAIAKVLGITQKSLLEAPKGGSSSASSKTSTAKKTATAKKTSSAAPKKTSSAVRALSLSAAEKKLVELYRDASSDNRKLATRILKGEKLEFGDVLPMLMANGGGSDDGLLGGLLAKVQEMMK